uniref:Uncharacterized protein n=1 Tax=Rhodogorgon sp. TaxID=2485824 RepID=A0A3G3MIA2_9FLOR|nr:hypothetical protein [Rhodogorgon sp.]
MTKYWPSKQSLQLNLAVASLVAQTYEKFSYNLSNTTKNHLPIDITDNYRRKELFTFVLTEIEILVLDIIELDLTVENLNQLNHKVLFSLIRKITQNFLSNSIINKNTVTINYDSSYTKLFFSEHELLLKSLLLYLIFGTEAIDNKLFPFHKLETPSTHVSLLMENAIIQISNIIVFNLLDNIKSLPAISEFLISNDICNSTYISIRSISIFRNNLIASHWINLYFYYPKSIYSSKYTIWSLSIEGLIKQYIHVNRSMEYFYLSKFQLFLILCLELQDFVIPKIKTFMLILGRFILYILIITLDNILKLSLKALTLTINSREK